MEDHIALPEQTIAAIERAERDVKDARAKPAKIHDELVTNKRLQHQLELGAAGGWERDTDGGVA